MSDLCSEIKPIDRRLLKVLIDSKVGERKMYKCEEQRIVPMAPPFRGFSAFVRFQCRAKLHHVERVNVTGMVG
ncbi:unnamed protein product [Angiostrongylus costaricensis]|uniref:ZP domain-containing protein n=1 Tax=Angiostrongylus costaricensis TaxID=334426 RepID=A0A0R3PVU6_ANGCS|nr:unnamed protein product [Angiostrongylus costaricensis]